MVEMKRNMDELKKENEGLKATLERGKAAVEEVYEEFKDEKISTGDIISIANQLKSDVHRLIRTNESTVADFKRREDGYIRTLSQLATKIGKLADDDIEHDNESLEDKSPDEISRMLVERFRSRAKKVKSNKTALIEQRENEVAAVQNKFDGFVQTLTSGLEIANNEDKDEIAKQ